MPEQCLDYTAQHWARAAAAAAAASPSGLVEKVFDTLIDPVVVKSRTPVTKQWGTHQLIPIYQDAMPHHALKQSTRLLPAIMSPTHGYTTRMLPGICYGIGASHTSLSSSPLTSTKHIPGTNRWCPWNECRCPVSQEAAGDGNECKQQLPGDLLIQP